MKELNNIEISVASGGSFLGVICYGTIGFWVGGTVGFFGGFGIGAIPGCILGAAVGAYLGTDSQPQVIYVNKAQD